MIWLLYFYPLTPLTSLGHSGNHLIQGGLEAVGHLGIQLYLCLFQQETGKHNFALAHYWVNRSASSPGSAFDNPLARRSHTAWPLPATRSCGFHNYPLWQCRLWALNNSDKTASRSGVFPLGASEPGRVGRIQYRSHGAFWPKMSQWPIVWVYIPKDFGQTYYITLKWCSSDFQ